ncbi:MAG: chromate transporter [Spirochaetes bacterium]|nr:chromate transporter [Spirochaetota bacterium]
MEETRNPGLFGIFSLFAGISTLTIGGGYAMIPVIARKVSSKGWLDEAEFYGLFATAQSLPGPMAYNTALLVGKRTAGAAGALCAGLGILLPPVTIVMIAAALVSTAGENAVMGAFLRGAGATVPGLVAALLLRMTLKRSWNPARALLSAGAAAAMIAAPVWAVPLFFVASAIAFLFERPEGGNGS